MMESIKKKNLLVEYLVENCVKFLTAFPSKCLKVPLKNLGKTLNVMSTF